MATPGDELPVVLRAYDLVIWTCKHLPNFPRGFRCTLGDRLETRLYTVLDQLVRARYSAADRPRLLREVNLELELLRFQYRIAKDLRCLALDSYEYAARTVNEIGLMVGGWLKSLAGRASPS
jgi:hypothetical protein